MIVESRAISVAEHKNTKARAKQAVCHEMRIKMIPHRYVGLMERIADGAVSGLVVDQVGADGSIALSVQIDGKSVGHIACVPSETDFFGQHLSVPVFGLHWAFPPALADGCEHEITFCFDDGTRVMFPGMDGNLTDRGKIHVDLAVAGTTTPNEPGKIDLSAAHRDEIAAIEESGLFDEHWYYTAYSDVAATGIRGVVHYVKYGAAEHRNPTASFNTKRYTELKGSALGKGRNPFAHFLRHGHLDDLLDRGMLSAFAPATLRRGIDRLEALPIYSDEAYLRLNLDVAGREVAPSHHAFAYGFPEGRSIFDKTAIARALGSLARAPEASSSIAPTPRRPAPISVGVYYNTLGNGFIQDLAQDLVTSLRRGGVDATLQNESSEPSTRPPVTIIVAPHEFFHLGAGRDWARDEIVRDAIMFNTEQPQTLWFERGMPFCLMSRGVIDICAQCAEIFAAAGVPATLFNPDIAPARSWLSVDDVKHPLVGVLPEAARNTPQPATVLAERPIDISFFGNSSVHRDNFFARTARFLAAYDCYIYYRRFEGPQSNSRRDGLLSRLAGHVTAHSKISLNIHRDDHGFFEWQRIVKLGMAGGSLVVSEPNLSHPLFKPGVHYMEETARHIPDLIAWLLKTKDGKVAAEAIRRNAMGLLADKAVAAARHLALHQFLAVNSNAQVHHAH